eukprot:TRINITY_DN66464_c0_g2_i4.p1 TRINITY_DN66464_c0_g2~~TRINITY_DN66464_c0_g2_i4.p1  ORF type:complete len:156 (+),score=4.75 TRINITY_DN66464_c0_g2_i4:124-591(+)
MTKGLVLREQVLQSVSNDLAVFLKERKFVDLTEFRGRSRKISGRTCLGGRIIRCLFPRFLRAFHSSLVVFRHEEAIVVVAIGLLVLEVISPCVRGSTISMVIMYGGMLKELVPDLIMTEVLSGLVRTGTVGIEPVVIGVVVLGQRCPMYAGSVGV